MSNTTRARRYRASALSLVATIALVLASPLASSAAEDQREDRAISAALSPKQQAIVPIAAAMASANMAQLDMPR